MIHKVVMRLRSGSAAAGKLALRHAYRGRPVPLAQVMFLWRLTGRGNSLFPSRKALSSTGDSLQNQFLAEQLADIEIGTWSLDVDTLNFLERYIKVVRPNTILEFGSGISTACLARYMSELHSASEQVHVFSLEQDLSYAERTQELLRRLELERHCCVIHAPLRKQLIEGVETTCYDLLIDSVKSKLIDLGVDLVLIDGPRGERFGSLVMAREWSTPGACFLADDALSERVLEAIRLWSRTAGVRLDGIRLVGKGILEGHLD